MLGQNVAMHPGGETTLVTCDGVTLSAAHFAGLADDPRSLCMVVAHGFTNGWRLPRVQRVMTRLGAYGGVVAIDFRGHGKSGGVSTVGEREIHDLDAGVKWARDLGYRCVVPVGFSMGGSVVLRQAAIGSESIEAVVSVSAPAFWYYRGTRIMRLLHLAVGTRAGRAVMRARGVRIGSDDWPDPLPMEPVAAAAIIDVPLLIVHGHIDHYFPIEHPKALHRAAVAGGNPNVDVWLVDGFAHAESGIDDSTLDAIGAWVRSTCGLEQIGTPVGWSNT
jgi:pimeloyl-ACP methyl ester carboxylesterase